MTPTLKSSQDRMAQDERALRVGLIPPVMDVRLILPRPPSSLRTIQRLMYGIVALGGAFSASVLVVALRGAVSVESYEYVFAGVAIAWGLAWGMLRLPRVPAVRIALMIVSLLLVGTVFFAPIGIWALVLLQRADTKAWYGVGDLVYEALS